MTLRICVTQLALLSTLGLVACSTTSVPTPLARGERMLQTDHNSASTPFHEALYHPSEISLNSEGFIVGIEKSPIKAITRNAAKDIKVKQQSFGQTLWGSRADARNMVASGMFGGKAMYISHILQNFAQPYGEGNCALYDVYRSIKGDSDKVVTPKCDTYQSTVTNAKMAYTGSWNALDTLSRALQNQLQQNNYSHIVVMTMGWNTTQQEAIKNMNALLGNIRKASQAGNAKNTAAFRPLVIAVTWPSSTDSTGISSSIKNTLGKVLPLAGKREDADQTGLTWLGVLLNDTIPEANSKHIPVVAIGHSFGANAMTTAACAGALIYRNNPDESDRFKQPVNYLIALQGAFSEQRLLAAKGDNDGVNFNGCPRVKHIMLTASDSDSAVSTTLWNSDAGANTIFLYKPRGILKYCRNDTNISNTPDLLCLKADSSGKVTPAFNSKYRMSYVDADELINRNADPTGGGAHSDIYRVEHGNLIWSYIRP